MSSSAPGRNVRWARAFLAQGCTDLEAANRLAEFEIARPPGRPGVASAATMLLQMALEKISKSGLLLTSSALTVEGVSRGHGAFARLVQTAVLRPTVGVAPIFLHRQWNDLRQARQDPLFRELLEIERHCPAIMGAEARLHGLAPLERPMLEYPWEHSPEGPCRWPERDLPLVREMFKPASRLRPRAGAYLRRVSDELTSYIAARE